MNSKIYKATSFGYFALSVPWFLLGIVVATRPGFSSKDYIISIMCLIIGILLIRWLLGFRIRINDSKIEYRDGGYRIITIDVNSITSVKVGKKKQNYRGGISLNFPVLIIRHQDKQQVKAIYINPLPFGAQIPKIIKEVNNNRPQANQANRKD
jgi:hypothetical protein